jgi:hypothetical protein
MKTDVESSYRLHVLNIKLQTDKNGADKRKEYVSLIEKIKGKHERVAENMHMILYSIFMRKVEASQTEYLYGHLGKGIYFDSETITNIGIDELTSEKRQPDRSMIQGSKETLYFFIPSIHKFCIICKNGINAYNTAKYLEQVLPQVISKTDLIEIEIVKEPEITEDILNAFAIHYLDYTISYTNDDPTSSMEQLFDDKLKDLHIGEIGVKMKADHHGSLNTEKKDELIEGGLKLAEKNGTVNEAIITPKQGGKRRTVSNRNKARKIEIKATDDNFKERIISQIIKIFI